ALRSAASRGPARRHSTSNPLEAIGRRISLPVPVPVPDWSKPIIVALLLIALWFGVRSRVAGVRARRLERQRASLLSDLGAMQGALVPEGPRRLGPLDVSVAYRPAEGPAAGGDFYDVFEPRPGQIAVVLGDVAGHGHEALKQAALTHFTLRAYLQAGLEPRAALALAGQVLCDPTGERYATVAVAVYDEPSSTLTYALAGHPPPMLLGYPAHEPVTVCSSPRNALRMTWWRAYCRRPAPAAPPTYTWRSSRPTRGRSPGRAYGDSCASARCRPSRRNARWSRLGRLRRRRARRCCACASSPTGRPCTWPRRAVPPSIAASSAKRSRGRESPSRCSRRSPPAER